VDIAEVGDRGVELREHRLSKGSNAKPAMVAAGTSRLGRWKSTENTRNGVPIMLVLPESW
jgi:hypothetical protein